MIQRPRSISRPVALSLPLLLALGLLTACGAKKEADATQVAARVNDGEITVHQLNYRLQQERGLKPEQMEEASRRVLNRLIDQEVAVQKAEQLKLDREPRVAQALDAARREVLSRAYFEQVAAGVAAPTEDAIRRYYDEKPELFSQRRIYALTEVLMQWPGDKHGELEALLNAGKGLNDVTAWLKGNNLAFKAQSATVPSENLPLGALPLMAKTKDGHGLMVTDGKSQAKLIFINGSKVEAVDFERAKPAITAFLSNDARRKALEANVQAMRTAAKIEFKGKFADMAKDQPELANSRSVDPNAVLTQASGVQVTLPAGSAAQGEQISLPSAASQASVRVSLPGASGADAGVKISLPASGADAGVRVQLPGQSSSVDADAVKKGLGVK